MNSCGIVETCGQTQSKCVCVVCVSVYAYILFLPLLFYMAHKELTNSKPLPWPGREGPLRLEETKLFSNCPAVISWSQIT